MIQQMCTKCHIRPRYLNRMLCEECLGQSYTSVLEEELERLSEPPAIDPDNRIGVLQGGWLALRWALIVGIIVIIARCVLDVVQ